MNTSDYIIRAASTFYQDLKNDANGRYRSWEYCYMHFISARKNKYPDIDYLSLHLAFYLASWGMYRGSSFLLQKDYKIHTPVVIELLNPKYNSLACIECADYRNSENQQLLNNLNTFLCDYYNSVRLQVKDKNPKNKISDTLITKILMGTLGCVPAYDRYFISGIKNQKISTGTYNMKSILKLVDFYENNKDQFEAVRVNMSINGKPYPQMKILDMGFWQIGFEADKKIKTKH